MTLRYNNPMSTSSSLSKDNILHLAKLANLSISGEEVQKYQSQFEQTIEYVDNLSELDTTSVEASASSTRLDNVYFDDGTENRRGLSPEQAMANTTSKKGNAFKVSRIL